MPGLLLCIIIVRKLSSNPHVPVVVVVHRSGSGGRGWPRDVAIELYGLSPGIGVALVAWVLEAGTSVLTLQSPGPIRGH